MYHTPALILRREEWNEADWRVTALTPQFGKIRLLAQGARKHGAKLQGHLEPGALADISFVIGRNGYRLTTARSREVFQRIRTSLPKLRAAAAILQTFDAHLLEERDQADEPFGIVSAAMAALDEAQYLGAVQRISVWCRVRFLAFLGLLPAIGTSEAAHIPSLLALAQRSLREVRQADGADDALERELHWLIRRVGGGTVPPPVALTDSALY